MPDQEVILTVDYDDETIGVSEEEARIHYAVGGNGDPENPRQVRWVVNGMKQTDELVIRPKAAPSAQLLNRGNEYRLFWPYVSAVSGPPVSNPFEGNEETEVQWAYDIEVRRDSETLFDRDPVVLIEREG